MNDLWIYLLLTFTAIVLLALLAYFAVTRLFSQEALRRRALKRQARREYEQARGTIHKKLLGEALRQPRRRREEVKRDLARTEWKKEGLLQQLRQDYLQEAQKAIVTYELTDVRGIGPTTSGVIRRQVFRGSLTDLHRARRVPGVGFQKQAAINAWIRRQQQRLPSYIEGDFPGKAQVTARYAHSLAEVDRDIATIRAKLEEIERTLETPEEALHRLEQVSSADFVRARMQEGLEPRALDAYLKGLFAEWEPVPAWFGELTSAGTQHDR